MVLFPNKNRPRRCLDLRVGGGEGNSSASSSHWLEVVVHLRRIDYRWYKDNEEDITNEFLELLESSIVPRIFGKEIENYHKTHSKGVIPIHEDEIAGKVGSKNKNSRGKKRGAVVGMAAAASGGINNKTKKKQATTTSRVACSRKSITTDQDIEEETNKKLEKDVYYSFGEIIQLTYRCEPTKSHRTILYREQTTKEDNNNSSKFYDFPKLSQQLLIWISKVDPDSKTNPDPDGVGFYRPEMLPVSSLFRKPDGEESSDEDLDEDDEQ
jgi:hypothetical protein